MSDEGNGIGSWSSTPPSGNSSEGRRTANTGDFGSEGDHRGHAHSGQNEDADRRDHGERSGISVQKPDMTGAVPGGNLVGELLTKAIETGPPVPKQSAAAAPTGLNTQESAEEAAIRHLTFWRTGFTVGDGELMRYDDPTNEQILNEIKAGRAPPSILNVLPGQLVELRVANRLQDDYVGAPRQH